MFAGVAAYLQGDKIEIGLSANDATYSIDFTVRHLDGDDFMDKKKRSQAVAEFVVETMREYQNNHLWYGQTSAFHTDVRSADKLAASS